jgi:hypothetical protein
MRQRNLSSFRGWLAVTHAAQTATSRARLFDRADARGLSTKGAGMQILIRGRRIRVASIERAE